ncbi:LysM domain protein [anaerobic digester metagenome]|jgi:nucleoid-associated protein YgaU
MSVTAKYQSVISLAQVLGFKDLKSIEKGGVLYITGMAGSEADKQMVWDAYTKIDPEMRGGDLIMNIDVDPAAVPKEVIYEVVAGDSLSKIAKKYPGVTWREIYEANKDRIKNPDLIQIGWKLKIPVK